VDELRGLKENVIVGHLVPAGTGIKEYNNLIVGSEKEYNDLINKSTASEDVLIDDKAVQDKIL
jgi:DNA-directed RNA polymerase subunit beta'